MDFILPKTIPQLKGYNLYSLDMLMDKGTDQYIFLSNIYLCGHYSYHSFGKDSCLDKKLKKILLAFNIDFVHFINDKDQMHIKDITVIPKINL